MLHFKKDWELNPELPVLGPWHSVRPINNAIWLLERNPYYYAVDTAGNQLPYFDKVQFTLAENLEVINLRAMAGEYDEQERHIDLGKLPVMLDNQEKGNYKVHLDLGFAGSDFMFHVNQSYTGRSRNPQMADQRRFPPRAVAGHRPRPAERDVLAGRRHAWLAGARRDACRKVPARNGARSGRCSTLRRPMRCSTRSASRRRTPMASACAPTMASAAAADHRDRCLPARIRSCPRWSPTSGARSASRPTCKEMERGLAFAKQTQQRTSTVRLEQWRHRAAVPVPAPGHPGRSRREAFGPAYAAWYASGGKQGTKPDDPNILKIFDLYTEAAGLKAEGRNRNAQEIWKILVDQQYGIGTVGQSPAGLGVRLVSQPAGQHRRPGVHRAALPHARQFASGDLVLQGMTHRRPCHCAGAKRRSNPHHDGDCFAPLAMTARMLTYLARRLVLAAITICAITRGDLRHHPSSARRFRHRLCRAGGRHGHGDLGRRGRCDAPRLRPQSAAMGAILEMACDGGERRFRPLVRIRPAGHRGDRRPALADGPAVAGRHRRHLGARPADRHLLRGAAILARRLRLHLPRLHRPGHAELPAGIDRDVFRTSAGSA